MQYVALFKNEKKGFGVSFPDFPGCTTFGEDLDEAVDMAHEALAAFVEMELEAGRDMPEPTPKKALVKDPANEGLKAINVSVEGDGSDFEEVELVMHTHLLGRIEKYCKSNGISPADFLAIAARQALKDDSLLG